MVNAVPELFDLSHFHDELAQSRPPIPLFKKAIKSAQSELFSLFEKNTAIELLIKARSHFVDEILTTAWQHFFPHEYNHKISLIAVGGYGRAELHPYSDVDILILFADDDIDEYKDNLESIITFLWDIGLEIGSSVRTLSECVEQATKDITVATNIVESRLIAGSKQLFENLGLATGPDKIWPSAQFFKQKWQEQIQRHLKNNDTAYNLEPNIKEGPGGLRDLQMIGWITKRHFGDSCLKDLVDRNFLTEIEFLNLQKSQAFLWKVRFALHFVTGRHEDRLLFEYQRTIAKLLGFEDELNVSKSKKPNSRASDGGQLGVELFMKQYYRTLKNLSLLNEMLLQDYQETLLYNDDSKLPTKINDRFQINKNFIEISQESVFQKHPCALLEIFLLLQQNKNIIGIRASTIRSIHTHLSLIDEKFRSDAQCKNLFIEIFKQPIGLTHVLRQMNTYGVLGAYLPCFQKITGQMQFDLFHIYTVEQHTIFVIRNMRRFFVDEYSHEFPLCSQIIRKLPKPELLYIAGLFHDIAKGRGGDHSKLGAVDAIDFCKSHGLSQFDSELVAWLVKNHLLMSTTAQHKDVSDPDVIFDFATIVGNNIKLDYLYLLTVADMRATNGNMWNSWKDSLLKSLRRQTKYAFQRGLNNPVDTSDIIHQKQAQVFAFIKSANWATSEVKNLWSEFGDEYFLRYTSQEIARHTNIILASSSEPIIHVEPEGISGGTDIFIKTSINSNLFLNSTLAINQLRLNIVEARIISSLNRQSLNTYTVFEMDGETVKNGERIEKIKHEIAMALQQNFTTEDLVNQKAHRRVELFALPTEITFVDDFDKNQTTMQIVTTDRIGLLSKIAYSLKNKNIRINNAKITTLGAQVDDVFLVRNDADDSCLSDDQKEALETQLKALLDF